MTDPRHSSIHGPDAQALGTPPVDVTLPAQLRAAIEAAIGNSNAAMDHSGDLHTLLLAGRFTTPEGAANLAFAVIEAHDRADRWSKAADYLRDLARDLTELDEDAPKGAELPPATDASSSP